MIPPRSPWPLTYAQGRHLQRVVHRYRMALLQSRLPSPERNTTLRSLQAVQGKLVQLLAQPTTTLHLTLSAGERPLLRTMLIEVLRWYGHEPISDERNERLADLAVLKAGLDRNH